MTLSLPGVLEKGSRELNSLPLMASLSLGWPEARSTCDNS